MAGPCRRLRQLAVRAAFAAVTAFALVPSADAQWLTFGAAPPGEIVERLRAEGYILIRPLERRDTIYLADVAGGPGGRERLVIDVWSGEILQRFAARRGGLVPEGGEFSEPPPLGPPPARAFREGNSRDFREGNYGNGPERPSGGYERPSGVYEGPSGGYEVQPKARAKSRPAATARRGGEPRRATPAAQPAEPQNAGTGTPGGAPAPGAAPPPAAAAAPAAAPANPNPAPSPAAAQARQKNSEQPAAAASSNTPPSAGKPEKKVNDVPVNPLE